jgi:hypothetical protein
MTRNINMPEKEYRKLKRDSERVMKLKPLIRQANNILKHTKPDPSDIKRV